MTRRKSKTTALGLLQGVLSLTILVLVVTGAVLYWGLTQFYAGGPGGEAPFLVEKGAGLNLVASKLEQQGLITNAYVFRGGVVALRRPGTILPGQYLIPAGASMAAILTLLTETQPQEFFVQVIPGDTSAQVVERLNDPALGLSGPPVPAPAEGTLLARRYDFFPGDTRTSILSAMAAEHKTTLAEVWAARDPAIDAVIPTPEALVVLASLVEKETGLAEERPRVAAVFINRLKRPMRLQTDPTVAYGITLGRGKLGRPLTKADLGEKTPYNTYQIDGLPPGPIANVGLEALNAAAHPAAADDLYFVAKSAEPADGHLFATTYENHRENVAQYRRAAAESEAEAAREVLEAEAAAGKSGGN